MQHSNCSGTLVIATYHMYVPVLLVQLCLSVPAMFRPVTNCSENAEVIPHLWFRNLIEGHGCIKDKQQRSF